MEYDKTNKIFTRPKIQATEDYVSGHFVVKTEAST